MDASIAELRLMYTGDIESIIAKLKQEGPMSDKAEEYMRFKIKNIDLDDEIEQLEDDYKYYRQHGQYGGCFSFKLTEITESVSVTVGMLNADENEKEIYNKNCCEIISLLEKKKDDVSFLTKAELYRNLSDYDMCIKTLDMIKEPPKYKNFITAIAMACDAKTPYTVIVEGFDCLGLRPVPVFWQHKLSV